MNAQEFYSRSPHILKNVIASMHGYYLRWWRYSKDTERIIEETLDHDTWSYDKLKNWQEEKLLKILNRAATKVPYYQSYWAKRRKVGDKTSWEYLENWPILTKGEVRKNPLQFIAEDCNPRFMFKSNTSGTSGTPITIYNNRKSLVNHYAMWEARTRKMFDLSVKDRWAIMGGQIIIPHHNNQPPFWVYNRGLNELYLSTFHINNNNIKHYFEIINKFKPTHMIVYPSSAAYLAELFINEKYSINGMKAIFSNAEFLSENNREIISEAFKCSVVNTYGMDEMVIHGSECKIKHFHIYPEVGLVEVFDDETNNTIPMGHVGRFIGTGLINEDMPLIRYETGDRGSLAGNVNCNCGPDFLTIKSIEGRISDLIITKDGRRIFWLNPVFYRRNIKEAQIIQNTINELTVRIVSDKEFDDRQKKQICDDLKKRVGDMSIKIQQLKKIPLGANGKFKPVISQLIG